MARGGTNHKGGRPKGSLATHTLQAQVARQELVEMYKASSKSINSVLVSMALEGDIQAIKELHDRVFGKAPQSVDMTVSDKLEIADDQFEQLLRAAKARDSSD